MTIFVYATGATWAGNTLQGYSPVSRLLSRIPSGEDHAIAQTGALGLLMTLGSGALVKW